jgi:hypothetical protein
MGGICFYNELHQMISMASTKKVHTKGRMSVRYSQRAKMANMNKAVESRKSNQ